jgi:hypothetical protein
MDTLFDAKRKAERAIAHINSIEKWLWTLNEENREIARAYKQDAPERNSLSVWVKQPEGFSLPLGPMIGDAVHNLRAALDAIAWSIVRDAGGGEDDLQNLYFPLCSVPELPTSRHFKTISAARADVGPIIADFVRDYKAVPDCDLWALNQLDRVDKHRCVIHTQTRSSGLTVAIRKEHEDDPPAIEPGALYGIPQTVVDGIASPPEELRPGSKAYVHNQTSGYTVVSIRFGEVLNDQEVIPKLWRFAELVCELIDELDEKIFRPWEPAP